MTAATILRPVHAWFGFWDAIAGPIARIVAVVVGTAPTAGLLVLLGVHPVVAAGGALAAWIGLAIAQEHDEHVRLPPDAAFTSALAAAVAGPPLRLVVRSAQGPARARPDEPEVFVLDTDADSDEGHPFAGWYIEVVRDRTGRSMHLSADVDEGTSDGAIRASWAVTGTVVGDRAQRDASEVAAALRSRFSG